MRILHVTRETGDDRRFGLGRSLQPVVDALRARGHELQYLTQDDLGPRARAAQPRLAVALRLPARGFFGDAGHVIADVWAERCNMGRLAAKVASQWRADAVHLHDPWIAWGYRLAASGQPRRRWGLSEHGFGAYADATREEGLPSTPRLLRALRRLEVGVLRAAAWVMCPAELDRQQLARDLAMTATPAHWQVVPHPRPSLRLPTRVDARRALALDPAIAHVVAIGRLNPVKRMDAIVQACAALDRPLRLTLLAGGDGAGLRSLAAGAPKVELDLRLVDDVAPFLAAADVYVSASRNESFGLATLEALAAGTPVVCTAVGAVPEVVGDAACMVAGADDGLAERLAAAMRSVLDNPQLAGQLAAAGPRQALRFPDAQALAARHEAIYKGGQFGA